MATERHETAAWLGDDHGLTDQQVDELTRAVEQIAERYPDPDEAEEREAAQIAAHRLLGEDTTVVEDLAGALSRARAAELRALAGLRQAAVTLIPAGKETQAGFARRAGVDRMSVREWLGLR